MKRIVLITMALSGCHLFAQTGQRFLHEVYSEFDTVKNVQFSEAVNIVGENEKLLLDFYAPKNDAMKKRPLVVFVHGGGYTHGDKAEGYPITFTDGLIKRGYAVALINYRLGIEEPQSDLNYFESMFRVMQDAKSAVWFMRKNAEKYGVDVDKIIIMGGSAGAHAVLHLAYLDENELPTYYNKEKLGGMERESSSPGYSSKVMAVINCWGAIVDYHWIKKGDIPMFNIHGVDDIFVPIDSSSTTKGFKYGSRFITQYAKSQGIYAGMKIYENTGHTLDNDVNKQKEALDEACKWLFDLIKS